MKVFIYIILVLIFLSCESRTSYDKPKDLIQKDQMIDLLIDMHFVNGITGVNNKKGIKANDYMSVLYEKYQIDSTRFASSNLYYISNISEYEKLLKEVKKRLEAQQIIFDDDSIIKSYPIGKKLKRPKIIKRNKDSILK